MCWSADVGQVNWRKTIILGGIAAGGLAALSLSEGPANVFVLETDL